MSSLDRAGARVLAELADVEPLPLAGGALEVPLAAAATLYLLPRACDPTARVALLVTPAGRSQARTLFSLSAADPPALAVHIAVDRELGELSDGDVLELCSIRGEDEDDEEDEGLDPAAAEILARLRAAARLRLRGTVGRGTWTITESYPLAGARFVRDAVEVCQAVRGEGAGWARDEVEACVLAELARRSPHFPTHNPVQERENAVTVDGIAVHVRPHRRPFLAILLLSLRLEGGPWDLDTARVDDQRIAAFLDRQSEVVRARLARAPGAEMLRTPRGVYRVGDLLALDVSEGRSVAAGVCRRFADVDEDDTITFAQAVARVDQDMAGVGLDRLGDFGGSHLGAFAYRGYGRAGDGVAAALAVIPAAGVFEYLFLSRIGDGRWVVTTTMAARPGASAPPAKQTLQLRHGDVAELASEHRARLAAQGAQPEASPRTIVEFAALLDRYLAESA